MWQRMMSIDRRWIFLAIGLAVILPYVLQAKLPMGSTNRRTQNVYDYIEKAKPGDAIILGLGYGPASMPEVHPMSIAITRHALRKNLRVIAMTINVQSALLIDDIFKQVMADPEFKNKKDGVDYVNLGFKPGGALVVLGMGDSITKTYAKDSHGQTTSQMPIFNGIRNFKDIYLLMALEATTGAGTWIFYGHEKFDVPLAMGLVAVMANDYYPYLQTGQLIGMINGMKGAAEYENLINHPDRAMLGMTAQSVSHITIILFVIIGNIGFFVNRRRKRGGR